jgi:hypothetical protein
MKSLIIGIVVIAAAVFAALPLEILGFGFGWWNGVQVFLRVTLSVVAVIFGLITVSFGIADIADIVRKPGKKVTVDI